MSPLRRPMTSIKIGKVQIASDSTCHTRISSDYPQFTRLWKSTILSRYGCRRLDVDVVRLVHPFHDVPETGHLHFNPPKFKGSTIRRETSRRTRIRQLESNRILFHTDRNDHFFRLIEQSRIYGPLYEVLQAMNCQVCAWLLIEETNVFTCLNCSDVILQWVRTGQPDLSIQCEMKATSKWRTY
jgi:hypothetical protein